MGFERSELIDPKPLYRLKPSAQAGDLLAPQRVDAHARIKLGVAVGHEAALLQKAQMLAHCGGRNADRLREFASGVVALAQQINRSAAHRIGKRRERSINVGYAHDLETIL